MTIILPVILPELDGPIIWAVLICLICLAAPVGLIYTLVKSLRNKNQNTVINNSGPTYSTSNADHQVSRNGQILGTYSESQLHHLIAVGQCLVTDYYWKPGMNNWQPLSNLKPKSATPPHPTVFQNQPSSGLVIKGTIINFNIQTGMGLISGENGVRYNFISAKWGSTTIPPRISLLVEFIANGQNAEDIYPSVNTTQNDNKISSNYYRSSDNGLLAGVCAGLAHKWNTDAILIRLGMLFIPLGWLIYIIGTSWPSKPTK
jgi:phage shock protein PspC (stress-responsive transcriptional regulator)